MLYFPQLLTGAVGQYPIQKRCLSRTVVNEAWGGTRLKLADPDASATAVLKRLAPIAVDVPADSVLNVNRPGDLARAEALLSRG